MTITNIYSKIECFNLYIIIGKKPTVNLFRTVQDTKIKFSILMRFKFEKP